MILKNHQQQPTDINHFQDMMCNVVYNVCSIVVMPIEMILRPFYGSRYFPPTIMFFTAILMLILPLFSEVGSFLPHFVPVYREMGLFGIGSMSKLFFFLSFIHGPRIWFRMINMHREKFSYFEGPPLPFFRWLPGTFWTTRIIWEPLFVFVIAIVLKNYFIIQPGLQTYLIIASVMLAMKHHVGWYIQWQFLRELLDGKNTGPVIASFIDNTATEDELAAVNLASLPKNLPDDLRRETAEHIARAYTNN